MFVCCSKSRSLAIAFFLSLRDKPQWLARATVALASDARHLALVRHLEDGPLGNHVTGMETSSPQCPKAGAKAARKAKENVSRAKMMATAKEEEEEVAAR